MKEAHNTKRAATLQCICWIKNASSPRWVPFISSLEGFLEFRLLRCYPADVALSNYFLYSDCTVAANH